ncbi:MAG: hypothetical protein GY950_13695 [bacterium]|nr:hypothetical protein [bacterium]
MFYKLIEEYSSIVSNYSVSEHKKYGPAYSLVAGIEFIDGSILYIKDYLFIDGKRKYSYHWQTGKSDLIARWDNSPHHKNISTFPHHRHLPDQVTASQARSLREVIETISGIIQGK